MEVSEERLSLVKLFGKTIGIDSPVIVAEIGINHNGDMKLCRDMIKSAKQCGVDSIKVQNYHTEQFIGQRSEFWEYKNFIDNGHGNYSLEMVKERQYDMFKRCELSFENLVEINEICEEVGIGWHSTPMDIDGLNDLLALNVPVLKNGSDCLQDLELIKAMAETGLPTVISTGMAIVDEIDAAVLTYRNNCIEDNLILLHCCSSYPAPDDSLNVSRIQSLHYNYGLHTGFSDHSKGTTAAILSVAMGSVWYEAHYTTNKFLPGPDNLFSKDPVEMKTIVDGINAAFKQLGDPALGMTDIEAANRKAWFK